ncbi:hypothetical protein RAC89_00855 [Paenibacillus sp. GD4]|uniref:exo-rhamnogalacturonan lyase family protein n=1 Tax=Paenibacillus sp. GD4 TaxID=3068890 RepID=UPI0027965A7A|nr:hypothetical protein [Paenibacillus sp. GD4]MDQ1909048.1 hypothetical protein [Paenibacillus sp. GD4]
MSSKEAVPMHWLKRPALSAAATWGVPWAEGSLRREEELSLHNPSSGASIPVQSWPTAYWPDGSIKWSAHAAVLEGQGAENYTLTKGKPAIAEQRLRTVDHPEYIEVDTGSMVCRFQKKGTELIRDIVMGGRVICSGGRLVGFREDRSETEGFEVRKSIPFQSSLASVEVEQDGPIRAVVKVSGRHRLSGGTREWLPFTLRFYLFANHPEIKIVHTFVYDGNPHQDYVKGLGLAFRVPMKGPLYNRYVRFAGDTGFFIESPKGLMNWRLSEKVEELYKQQMRGIPVSFDSDEDAKFLGILDDSAVWDGFKLTQLSADSYAVSKRTKEGCSWIKAVNGRRAGGLGYVGSESGGMAVTMRHFWRKYPSSLEAFHLSKDEAELTAWLWSPDADAMDLRHYDTETHVESAYEGAHEMRSTPYGVGNTNELSLWCFESTPEPKMLESIVEENESPSLLVCPPERYQSTYVFGPWSLPDRSTPLKAYLEEGLEEVVRFYQDEVERRGWYGFWDYGDVMHSYDPVRHTWKYDIGGCAWQNTELATNYWLWYVFLRTGKEDFFRLAEAMTRHTSETDIYHAGEYAGLGSRHNVLHWGCGCKEARIAMAGLHRMYYYLTADERIGDVMDEVKDADYSVEHLDPMRYYFPKDEFPTHVRSGPDWAAFCSNWSTRWERYEDTRYRDKMVKGIECLKSMPYRLLTGPTFGYNAKTGDLLFMGNENSGHQLMMSMGGAQVWMELVHLLKDPEWEDMVVEFGEFYNLPKEEKARRTDGEIVGKDWGIPMLSSPLVAFAAAKKQDKELADLAWQLLLGENTHWQLKFPMETKTPDPWEYATPVREIPWMSTNTAAQWSLNVIICLELIGNYLPGDEIV